MENVKELFEEPKLEVIRLDKTDVFTSGEPEEPSLFGATCISA